jgi:hypothetical protein
LALIFAANRIDHDVGANAQFGQILRFSINYLICTQPAHIIGITAKHSTYDPQLPESGELHRISSYIPRATMHDDGLAFTCSPVIEQHLPGRYAYHRQCRRFEMRQAGRPASDHSRIGNRIFGVTVDEKRIGGAKDLISKSEFVRIRPELFDDT